MMEFLSPEPGTIINRLRGKFYLQDGWHEKKKKFPYQSVAAWLNKPFSIPFGWLHHFAISNFFRAGKTKLSVRLADWKLASSICHSNVRWGKSPVRKLNTWPSEPTTWPNTMWPKPMQVFQPYARHLYSFSCHGQRTDGVNYHGWDKGSWPNKGVFYSFNIYIYHALWMTNCRARQCRNLISIQAVPGNAIPGTQYRFTISQEISLLSISSFVESNLHCASKC